MNALAAEPSTGAPAGAWRAALAARFKALSARERIAVLAAGALLALALLWLLAIGPAWRTVSEAPARIEALDAQLQQMRQQAAQAVQWRSRPALPPGQAQAALSAATARLNEAGRLTLQGERAVLSLKQVSAEALQAWLAEARSGARARVIEADLTRSGAGYDGTVILALGGGS